MDASLGSVCEPSLSAVTDPSLRSIRDLSLGSVESDTHSSHFPPGVGDSFPPLGSIDSGARFLTRMDSTLPPLDNNVGNLFEALLSKIGSLNVSFNENFNIILDDVRATTDRMSAAELSIDKNLSSPPLHSSFLP